jgi:hypothetical protein
MTVYDGHLQTFGVGEVKSLKPCRQGNGAAPSCAKKAKSNGV